MSGRLGGFYGMQDGWLGRFRHLVVHAAKNLQMMSVALPNPVVQVHLTFVKTVNERSPRCLHLLLILSHQVLYQV